MERQPLAAVYTAILKSLYCSVDDDGVVKSLKDEPYRIGDNVVVVPTHELLKENDWKGKVAFHPLCEDLLAGQSDITRWLIKRVNAAIALNVCHLVLCSLQIAQNPALQSEIKDGSYTQYIEILGESKESTINFFRKKLMKAFGDEESSVSFSNLYVSRAGELNGKTYSRIATLEIPMLNENTDDTMLLGIKAPNKADKRMIIDFVAKLFDGVPLEVGSNGNVPYFEAIMRLYYGVANRLNKVRKTLKGGIDDSVLGTVSLSWHKWLDEGMNDQIGVIPPLSGNVGPVEKAKKPRGTVSREDDEITSLVGRSSSAASTDTPPWRSETDEPVERDREVQPVTKPGGISIIRDRDDRRERDRDRDRDRDRGSRDRDRYDRDDRRDRERGSRVSIFDREDRERDRDYDRDRGGRRDDRRRDDRRRDRDDRDRGGSGISILGNRR